MRVFLDTNLLVSAFATRGLCADVLQVCLVEHQLVLGETVLAELQRILQGKIGLPPGIIQEADVFLRRQAMVVSDAPLLSLAIREREDLPVLAEAIAGNADVLVTGDKDLLDLPSDPPLSILSPRAFWEELRSNPSEEE